MIAARSDPEMPESRGATRAQPGRSGSRGCSRLTSRNGAAGPVRIPGIRRPMVRAAMYFGSDRYISSASITFGPLLAPGRAGEILYASCRFT